MDQLLVNSSGDHSVFDTSTHKSESKEYYTVDGWTFAENKLYENVLAMCQDMTNYLAFLQHVAFLMPWKTIEAIHFHHQLLLKDLKLIESSNVDFGDTSEVGEKMKVADAKLEEPKKHIRRPMKKAIPWTVGEHKLFLKGLEAFGKGDCKNISKTYVTTKTPSQIASHAQKFEKRRHTKTPVEKRRSSINDIQCLCSCPQPTLSNPPQNLAASDHGFPSSKF